MTRSRFRRRNQQQPTLRDPRQRKQRLEPKERSAGSRQCVDREGGALWRWGPPVGEEMGTVVPRSLEISSLGPQ